MSVSSLSNARDPRHTIRLKKSRGEAGRGLAGAGGGEENAGEDMEGLRQTYPVVSSVVADLLYSLCGGAGTPGRAGKSQESLVGCTCREEQG